MLDLRKTLTLLVLLPACSFPAFSQRSDSFWGKIVDLISAPSMELDPSAVYQPAARWNVAVSGELHQAGGVAAGAFQIYAEGHALLAGYHVAIAGGHVPHTPGNALVVPIELFCHQPQFTQC